MKIITTLLMSLLFLSGSVFGQISKEDKKLLKEYYFNEGFTTPATKKVSTVILKNGEELRGYCKGVKMKKGQITTILFKDSITGDKEKIDVEKIAEAYLFASKLEKFDKVNQIMSRIPTNKRTSLQKATTNDEIYFVNQSVSLKNKKAEQEFLMQLINPGFNDLISVYYDPIAAETGGFSAGVGGIGANIGGGTIKSYYIKKGDRIFYLKKNKFKDEYENLFGDNKEFMEKYPYAAVNWKWLSGLILEYTKMTLEQES